jgi:hypothetical protein
LQRIQTIFLMNNFKRFDFYDPSTGREAQRFASRGS